MTTHSTSAAQSKSSGRLLIFTIVSTLLCCLALANVASAAPSSAEDQYIEKAPTGTGTNEGPGSFTAPLGSDDGTVSEEDVEKAAKKKKKEKKKKDDKDGPTGGTAAVGSGGTGTPPTAATPVAAASNSPLSNPAMLALGAMALAIGGAAAFTHFRKPVPTP